MGGSGGCGGEGGFVEECTGAVDEAVVLVLDVGGVEVEAGGDTFAVEASEDGSGAGSVEALVVVEDANEQR